MPDFLQLDEIRSIHRDQISRYGGSPGVWDTGLLQSAVAMPQASFGGEFLHRDLFEMAAAYLFHIVQNHPFIDGNKRAGTAAAIVFLAMNDVQSWRWITTRSPISSWLWPGAKSISRPSPTPFANTRPYLISGFAVKLG